MRRIQLTIRQAMALVGVSGLLCFGLRFAPPDLLQVLAVIAMGSAIGAAVQRLRRGGGVLGGAAGGAMAYTGLLASTLLWLYLNPQTKTRIAEPVNAFLFTVLCVVVIGSVVGLLVRTWFRLGSRCN